MEKKATILRELIQKRRSIYPAQYNNTKEIAPDILYEIFDAGNKTPQHKKTTPWRFQLFQGVEKNKLADEMCKLYKIYTEKDIFSERKQRRIFEAVNRTTAIISISVNFSGLVPEWEEIAAVAMGVQNMYLTCTAYQLGCYWSSPKFSELMSDFLQLDENQKCLGFFYIGCIDEETLL